jgi:hypothetical protein
VLVRSIYGSNLADHFRKKKFKFFFLLTNWLVVMVGAGCGLWASRGNEY